MSWFLRWWGKYKRKHAASLQNLPPDFEGFIKYLDARDLSLHEKQEIVRFLFKDITGEGIKETHRNLKKLRRAHRFYHEFRKGKRVPAVREWPSS